MGSQSSEGRRAQPQWIGAAPAEQAAEPAPRRSGRMTVIAVLVTVLVLVAGGIGAYLLFQGPVTRDRIQNQIGRWSKALEVGDLTTLRDTSCGELLKFYQDVNADQFQKVREQTVQNGEMPKILAVNQIQVTGTAAAAEVQMQTEHREQTARIDLQKIDGTWRVCHQPTTGP